MGGDRETQLRLVERAGGVVAEVHDRLQMPERLDHLALVRQLGAAQAIDQPPGLVAGRHLRDHVLELAQTVDGHGSFPNPPTVLPANRPGETPAGYRLSRPEARIRRPEWAILPAVRAALLPLVLLLGLAGAAVPAEQTVTPLPPVTEQRVEPIDAGSEQHVEQIDPEQAQRISTAEKSPVRRGVETAGKVALGVVALGISLGFTFASLLLF